MLLHVIPVCIIATCYDTDTECSDHLRKFENRRNNNCLTPLLDARGFSRWCTILKMFEFPA